MSSINAIYFFQVPCKKICTFLCAVQVLEEVLNEYCQKNAKRAKLETTTTKKPTLYPANV